MGQFLTPPPVANLMASMVTQRPRAVRILDAGAGVGMLFAALTMELCKSTEKPESIDVVAYELEPAFCQYLPATFNLCADVCRTAGVMFHGLLLQEDFVECNVRRLNNGLSEACTQGFTHAILNPPYRKIKSDTAHGRLLRSVGIETTNLYTAFLWLAMRLLASGGELIAITPRSFCSGPYFRRFRRAFLDEMAFRRIHTYESRTGPFAADGVLQENIVFSAVKGKSPDHRVTITGSAGPEDSALRERVVDDGEVVDRDAHNPVIFVEANELEHALSSPVRSLECTLVDLDLEVSTGRVVDFRAQDILSVKPDERTAPLIYPVHLSRGAVDWPVKNFKKAQAILELPAAERVLIPAHVYVLMKRFTAKEERRRVVAAVFDPARVRCERVGFENHLNYYHHHGGGLPMELARGLTAYLNSSHVDRYLRQFSGHTQVNATDLRALPYPIVAQLARPGQLLNQSLPKQSELDELIATELGFRSSVEGINPLKARRRIDESSSALKEMGLPRELLDDSAALVMLALANIDSRSSWHEARASVLDLAELREWIWKHYLVSYVPRAEETLRMRVLEAFVGCGIASELHDLEGYESDRNRYQLSDAFLTLLRSLDHAG